MCITVVDDQQFYVMETNIFGQEDVKYRSPAFVKTIYILLACLFNLLSFSLFYYFFLCGHWPNDWHDSGQEDWMMILKKVGWKTRSSWEL